MTPSQQRYYIKNRLVIIAKAKLSNNRDIVKRRLIIKQSDAKKWKVRREFLNREKCKPCRDCKIQYNPWVMDFDHRTNEIKCFNISQAMKKSLIRVKQEIIKCDVVCSNCHRERTHNRLK